MEDIFGNCYDKKPICFSNLENDLESIDAFKIRWEIYEAYYGTIYVFRKLKLANLWDIAHFIQLLLYHKKYDIAYYFTGKIKKYRKYAFEKITTNLFNGMVKHINIKSEYIVPIETSKFLAYILNLNDNETLMINIYRYFDRRYNTSIPIEIGRNNKTIRSMNLRMLWESVLIKNNNRGDLCQFDDYIIKKILEYI